MNQILKNIEMSSNIFPIQEIEEIRQAKSDSTRAGALKYNQYIDALIESIKYATENAEDLHASQTTYFLHIYALYLLAEFKEEKAFPFIADFIELDREKFAFLSYDMVTDHLASVLASVFNGDQRRLQQVIENKEANVYVRSSALQAYKVLVYNQIVSEKDFEQYLRAFIQKKLDAGPEDDQNSFVFVTLILVIMESNLYDLRLIVQDLYMNGYIDTFFVGDYSDFIDDLFKEHIIEEKFVDDAIEKLIVYEQFTNAKQYKPKKEKTRRRNNYLANEDRFYFDKDMAKYPPLLGKYGLKGLGDFFDSESIEIDKAMYKAMIKNKSYNTLFSALLSLTRGDDDDNEEDVLFEHFELAYQLFLLKTAKESIKSLEKYDKKYMIHYPIIDFLDGYFSLLYKKFQKTYDFEYISKSIEIIEVILNRFSLQRGYRAYLKRKMKQLQDIDDFI